MEKGRQGPLVQMQELFFGERLSALPRGGLHRRLESGQAKSTKASPPAIQTEVSTRTSPAYSLLWDPPAKEGRRPTCSPWRAAEWMRQLVVWNVSDGRRGSIQRVRHVSSPTTDHAGIIHCFSQRWAHHASVSCSDVDFAASTVLASPPHSQLQIQDPPGR
jgi:hypothetical protein